METKDNATRREIEQLEKLLPKKSEYCDVYGICYLAYKMNGHELEECRQPKDLLASLSIKHRLWEYLEYLLDCVDVGALYELSQKIVKSELKEHLLSPFLDARYRIRHMISTPEIVNRIALEALDIQSKDTVLNINSGDGVFVVEASSKHPEAKCIGVEADEHVALCSLMRADIADTKIDVRNEGEFEWFDNNGEAPADKVFLTHPFLRTTKNMAEDSSAVRNAIEANPVYEKREIAGNWMCAQLAIDSITSKGRAVVPFATALLEDLSSLPARKMFVKSGWIETVISLPKGVFYPLTNIRTSIVVLSHGNTGIRFIDATDISGDESHKKFNFATSRFTPQDIEAIIEWLSSDGEHSRILTIGELEESGYRLAF